METPEWLAEPFTRAQAWVDLLLLANHKRGHIRKRGILIEIQRGQVGFSEESLAARWKWSRGKVLRFLRQLIEKSQISRNPVHQNSKLSNLITITNYELYQSDSTTSGTTNGTGTRRIRNKEKDPEFFSSRISVLRERYPSDFQKTLDDTLKAVSSTRKSGRIADSVKVRILEKWQSFPVDQVMGGCRVYLEKGYHKQGKDEKYLLGIIRNHNGQSGKIPSLCPGPSPADDRAVSVVTCPACGRTVTSQDMAGNVCIICSEVKPHV